MSKSAEIDNAKIALTTVLDADQKFSKGLQGDFDEFVERKACSADMVVDLATMLEKAFNLGRDFEAAGGN